MVFIVVTVLYVDISIFYVISKKVHIFLATFACSNMAASEPGEFVLIVWLWHHLLASYLLLDWTWDKN